MQATTSRVLSGLAGMAGLAAAFCSPALAAGAATGQPEGFLETIHRHTVVTSTIAPNGDQNPYAVIVAPGFRREGPKGRRADHKLQQLRQLARSRDHHHGLEPGQQAADHFCRHPAPSAVLSRRDRADHGDDDVEDRLGHRGAACQARMAPTATKGSGCLLILDPQGAVAGERSPGRRSTGHGATWPWSTMAARSRFS